MFVQQDLFKLKGCRLFMITNSMQLSIKVIYILIKEQYARFDGAVRPR